MDVGKQYPNRRMKQNTPSEQEYVLGTHDEEITRLGLQHRRHYSFSLRLPMFIK